MLLKQTKLFYLIFIKTRFDTIGKHCVHMPITLLIYASTAIVMGTIFHLIH